MQGKLMTLDECAARLAVTYARAAALARTGILPTVKLGRQWRVSPESLEAFIANGGKALPGGWRREAGGSIGRAKNGRRVLGATDGTGEGEAA